MKRWFVFLIVGVLLLFLAGVSLAAPNFLTIHWWTVDGGGGQSSGGTYSLSSAIGQPDAGSLSGGSYVLQGGFFSGAAVASLQREIFLPIVTR